MNPISTIDKNATKEEQYAQLLTQIRAIVEGEHDLIANLGNVSSLLKYWKDWFWVGFYLAQGNELVLSSFQGTLACTRIQKGRGVCGKAWSRNQTILVDDVEMFQDHIACSSETRSEIVVPMRNKAGECVGVLDVDSKELSAFDEVDQKGLEEIVEYLSILF